jgi:PAS domain S-box-containing protein
MPGPGEFMRRMKEPALPYVLAILAALAALFLRRLLNPLLGEQNPYHTLWLAVVFSAWYCGIGPSVITIAIGVAGIWYWFLPPYGAFASKDPTAIFGVLGFLAFSAVIVALGESTRRIIKQRKLAEEGLRKAQQELHDRVRERTQALHQKTVELAEKAALLDLANDAIFIRTVNDTISYWNHGAERLYGWSAAEVVGRSPHDLLHTEFPVPFDEIASADSWAGELRHNKRDGTQIVVASRWTTLRDQDGKAAGWLEINTDITARKWAEDAARSLSGRILTLQDDERRRIARDLHDSLGQYLAALKLSLASLSTTDGKQGALDECFEIVDRCITETRTISHLLHPPLLDEVGFGSAARWFVEGFAKRSGIAVNLDLSPEVGRLRKDAEIGLFRTVQESLTNVHRHSGGSAVEISLRILGEQLRLEITDNGRGISEDRLRRLREGNSESGVGIAGMRERVRELGGALEIESGRAGTKVILSVPVDRVSAGSAPGDRSGQSVSVA